MTKKNNIEVDPITLSVVWNRLLNLTRDMGERVVHSAQSFVMGVARDLGSVLLNDQAQIITAVEFLPSHCLLAEVPTKAILDKFGQLERGDMVIGNDPFILRSGHLCDWTFLVPIYYKDELLFYGHFRGHMMDTGGSFQGSYFPRAYDIIAEGINLVPLKLMEKGEVNRVAKDIIFRNVRNSNGVWSDVMLIYGSISKGEDAIAEIVEKYGIDTVRACFDEIITRTEKAVRDEIREMPDGEYYGDSAVDWDGSVDKPVRIKVKLTVKGDELIYDFTGTDEQVDFVNSPLGNTSCYTYLATFLTMDPSIPRNHGSMAPIKIIAPEGTVVNPVRPGTVGACGCSSGTEIYEACAEAIAKAVPEKAQGLFCRHLTVNCTGRLPFIDPRSGQKFEYFGAPFIEEGGSGARKGYDGWDGMCSTPLAGVVARGSVEVCEYFMPFMWHVAELGQDREGPGEFMGSRGVVSERENVGPPGSLLILMSGDTSGQKFSPKGVAGAPPVPLGELEILNPGKTEKELFRTMDMSTMEIGAKLFTKAHGGSGWGDPLDRDLEKVMKDVRDQYISIERARDVYGVVFKNDGSENPEDTEVDIEATEDLRKEKKASQQKEAAVA